MIKAGRKILPFTPRELEEVEGILGGNLSLGDLGRGLSEFPAEEKATTIEETEKTGLNSSKAQSNHRHSKRRSVHAAKHRHHRTASGKANLKPQTQHEHLEIASAAEEEGLSHSFRSLLSEDLTATDTSS